METISAYSAEVLRLLGQITRLRIVEALREKELYVSEIFTILEEEQSNVSKHLSQMAQNGILGTRKDPDSPKCYYRVKLTGIFGIIDLAKRLVERERDGVQGVAALPFVAGVLKEIGQPSRMAIIAALRDGERPVTDIVKAVELERSNASRHLSGMKAAGIVARRVDERMQAHYRLANDYTLIDCGFDPPSGGARCEEQAGGAARWYSGRKFYMNAAQHQDGNGRPAPRVGLFFRLFLSV